MSGQTAERTSAEAEEVPPTRAAADGASAWSPLRHPVFRALWIAALFSNIGTWMQDVGAGWLMTSLDPSPLMVALIQAATTLPIVILSLPAGALARHRRSATSLDWHAGLDAAHGREPGRVHLLARCC